MITENHQIEPFSTKDSNHLLLREFARIQILLLDETFVPTKSWVQLNSEDEREVFYEANYRDGDDERGFEVMLRSEFEPRAGGEAVNAVRLRAYGLPAGMHFEMECTRSWHNPRFITISLSGPEEAVSSIVEAFKVWFGAGVPLEGAALQRELASIIVAVKAGQWAAVEKRSRSVLKHHPDAVKAVFGLGVSLVAQDNLAEGEKYLQRVLELEPEHYDGWYNLGLVYMKRGRHTEAINTFRQSLEIRADNHPVLYQLGYALEAAGQRRDAMEAYRDAVRTSPNPDGAWGYRGMDLTQQARDAIKRLMS